MGYPRFELGYGRSKRPRIPDYPNTPSKIGRIGDFQSKSLDVTRIVQQRYSGCKHPYYTMWLNHLYLWFPLTLLLAFITTVFIRTEPTKGCIPMNTGVTRIQFTNTANVHLITPGMCPVGVEPTMPKQRV